MQTNSKGKSRLNLQKKQPGLPVLSQTLSTHPSSSPTCTHAVTRAKRDSFTAGHLSPLRTRTGGRQALGTRSALLNPSAPQPSFVQLAGQQTPLTSLPRGCGCWCEGDVPCRGSPRHREGFHGHAAAVRPRLSQPGHVASVGGHAQRIACVPRRSPSLRTTASNLLFVFQFILFLRKTQVSPR